MAGEARFRRAALSGALLAVASTGLFACGGGGGGNAPTPAPPQPVTPTPAPTPVIGSARFLDRTRDLGLDYFIEDSATDHDSVDKDGIREGGGLALVDIDGDGGLELYVAHGRNAMGRLFDYDGSRFVRVLDNRGIAPKEIERAGYFVDLDADGYKDFVSVQQRTIEIFRNEGGDRFVEATAQSHIRHHRSTFSMAAADVDLDGDLDLFFSHWDGVASVGDVLTEYLWQNTGQGVFVDISDSVAIRAEPFEESPGSFGEFSFTPTFADIDDDGYPDMLLASDAQTSQVLRNEAGIRFVDATTDVIDDKNGMGGTVADYDRDGDLDWFVSSIHTLERDDNDVGSDTGNRLYRNMDGLGNFEDATDEANVRNGDWGWGSCFADFDNDGHLDLFHTNGYPGVDERYEDDPSRLFMSNGDGSFSERAFSSGVTHDGQGRGTVCADYNDDGRVDILVATSGKAPTLYENVTDNDNHYLAVDLVGLAGNRDAVGARVTIETVSGTQLQEVQLGTWYLSQGPATLHFGLGRDDAVDTIEVRWPGSGLPRSTLRNVAVDQRITIEHP
ncbi:MAG: CRTAC1 family protein [Gammaproteobacteria bacterium]|nr:CRTAC1 family protein [Gammaproteobacteria bacterium]